MGIIVPVILYKVPVLRYVLSGGGLNGQTHFIPDIPGQNRVPVGVGLHGNGGGSYPGPD